MTDIRSKAAAETYTFQLKDSDDEPLVHEDGSPVNATVYGPGTKQFQAAKAAQATELMARMRKKGSGEMTPDEKVASQAKFLAAVTKDLELEYDGKTGRELAIAVYGDITIGFIAEQVHAAVHDWSNFTKRSPTI